MSPTRTGLEPIADDLPAAARVFNFNFGAETITISDDGVAANGKAFINSNVGGESVTFQVPTASITVNAGSGADLITLEDLDSSYLGTVVINGDADNDDLTATWANGSPLQHGVVTWNGGAGTNTFALVGGAGFTTVTHDFTAGSLDVDAGNDFVYTGSNGTNLEDLASINKVFNFTAGVDAVVIANDGAPSNNRDRLTTAGITLDFGRPTTAATFNGLAGNDTFKIEDLDNGDTHTLTVNGGDDNDIMTADWANGAPALSRITFNGDAGGTNFDSLVMGAVGVGTATTVTHVYTNAFDGFVTVDGGTLTYTGLEPITDNLSATNRIFNFSGSADAIDFDFVPNAGQSIISSTGPTSETTTFTNPTGSLTINGNGGDDTFNVEPALIYPITVNGNGQAVADTFTLDSASLGGGVKITLTESSTTDGVYSFNSAHQPVTYTGMEIVSLRFSDPNAYPLATYPGDIWYPLHTETGISIEPYFNWDIEHWPAPAHLSSLVTLRLDVSLNSDLSVPVFSTITKENNVTALTSVVLPNTDHYITDVDNDVGIPLLNNKDYYWGLTATLLSGDIFCQVSRFKTIPALLPALTYPKDALTIPSLDFDFHWNVGSATQPEVYWRIDVDSNVKASFNGKTPFNVGGDIENDNDKLPIDGFADNTQFKSSDLRAPLTWGTTYSWRTATMWPVAPTGWVPQEIFDKNETDRMVSISSLFQFQTQTLAYVPTPSYPTGGLTVPSNAPLLSWWVGGPFGALTFNLEIREAISLIPYCNVATWPTGVTGTQFNTSACSPALIAGKNYEWRVQSTDGTTTSAFSAWAAFSTNGQGVAGPATPSYPNGNLENYTTNPQLHWFTQKDNTGISFTAHYAKRPTLPGTAPVSCTALKAIPNTIAGDVFDLASPLSTTYVDALGLVPGATYDWCVTSTGLNGTVEGTVATFKVAGGLAKNFPVASWPKPNPTIYSLTQILHWYLEGSYFDVLSYEVEWCKGIPSGTTPVFLGAGCTTVAGITQQQLEISGLAYGDIVIWRVRAHYTSGSPSDWDAAIAKGGFTVTGLLSGLAANLTYPAGNLIIYDSDATFSWWVSGGVGVANKFKIQYSYAETFPINGAVTIETFSTTAFLNVTGLIPGHTYWWRVAVSNDNGATYGAWSTVASFAVHPGASAVMPRIGSPSNTMTIATSTPTLSWVVPAESESVLTYDLRYASTEAGLESSATILEGLMTPFTQLSELVAGDYFWQVRSRSTNGDISPYSPVGEFTTTASFSVGVEDEEITFGELPTSFELGQNYPNPFNPSTTIEFRMSESANVSLKVYNVLGQVVKTLVSGTMPSGVHHVTWDARDETGSPVSSGLYLYRMESTGFSTSKTLVLMK